MMHPTTRKSVLATLALASAWPLAAQTAPESTAAATPPAEGEEEVVVLTPFEVRSNADNGYQATETLAGTRIRTQLKDVGSSISVMTKEFLQDVGATNNASLLQYTTNTEVSGTLGTYSGLGNSQTLNETNTLRSGGANQRVRGLASADNTRDFFTTDIPWDSYNVERVDIQRGPNSIMFGLGSPAGIINASVNNAGYRTKGQAEFRFGSYGSLRGSFDYNQVLLEDVLSFRVAALSDKEQFKQDPAYEDDNRVSIALRFDPKWIKAKGFTTSFKVKYESGDIDANRPRTLSPYDNITPWFRPVQQNADGTYTAASGLGKVAVNYPADVTPATNPWIGQTAANQQQPIWFMDGSSNELYQIYGGFVNRGRRTSAGAVGGASDSLVGQRYGDVFPGIRSFSGYAVQAKLPGYQDGQYRDVSLTDSSIFDFYNQLIDGDTKKEFANWHATNLDFTQTAWDDRIGIQLTYDKQSYKRGGESLLSVVGNPAISVDIMRNFQDRPDVGESQAATNPNFGRAYVVGGPGGGTSYKSNRDALRASLFGEFRASDIFGKGSFWTKLIGRHRFNGVYSKDTFDTEDRGWQMYANSQAWNGFWNKNTGSGVSIKERPPVAVIYLGSNGTAGSADASNLDLPGIAGDVTIRSGNVYHFDSTWNAASSVGYATPWTVPDSLTRLINNATPLTEASNPANYVGWNSNFANAVESFSDGKNPSLLTSASLAQRKVKSYAGTWQGYLWNDAIVPTLGWRFDEVKTLSGTTADAKQVSSNRGILNIDQSAYHLPETYGVGQIVKSHSTAGGVVVHLNKFLTKDPLPLNVSLSFNKSRNFQVTNARSDFYGNAIGNPSGETKEYGIMLSTKDGKYSMRLQKYETSGKNVSMDTSLDGLANAITQGIKFRNVLLYRLNGYTLTPPADREVPTSEHGKRFQWYQGYRDNTTGMIVADYNETNPSATPQPANTTLETLAEAAQRRDDSITAWNNIQQFMTDKGFFSAWQYNPTTLSALTTRANLEATAIGVDSDGKIIYAPQFSPAVDSVKSYQRIAPAGLALTSDNESDGYEFEFTANPTQSLRLTFNAAKTTAIRSNVGSADLDETVAYMDAQMLGNAGNMRQFNGAYVANNELRATYATWRGQYALAKLQDGAAVAELRKWRFNLVANYTFVTGTLKGAFVGGGYRWQSKNVIGYPMVYGTASNYGTYDLTKPFYGPSEDAIDLWAGYSRKLTEKIDWKIQLNVRNVGDKDGIIPITVQPDGVTPAAYRIKPSQEWSITNTFSF
jgi:outer membrane receptor protein involved in Fe transport